MDENYTFENRYITAIAWNSRGTHIAIATSDWGGSDSVYVNNCLRIINAASGKAEITLLTGSTFGMQRLAWRNADREIVAMSEGGDFRCFDVQAGCTIINQWDGDSLVQSDFNPSRTQVACVVRRMRIDLESHKMSDEPAILEVYDIESHAILQKALLPSQDGTITDWFGWSADGKMLAMTNRKGNVVIYQWDGTAFSFQHKTTFVIDKDHAGVTSGAWGPDSRHLALANDHDHPSAIAIYDAVTNEVVRRLDKSVCASALTWSAEHNLIAARPIRPGPPYPVRIWDGNTGQIVGEGPEQYFFVQAWSPDGVLAGGASFTYEEYLQDPTMTGVTIQRPKSLPPR